MNLKINFKLNNTSNIYIPNKKLYLFVLINYKISINKNIINKYNWNFINKSIFYYEYLYKVITYI